MNWWIFGGLMVFTFIVCMAIHAMAFGVVGALPELWRRK